MELEIILIKFYSKFCPQNIHISKNLAKQYSGTSESFMQLQRQLLDKYGKDMDHIMDAAGHFRFFLAAKSNRYIPHVIIDIFLIF